MFFALEQYGGMESSVDDGTPSSFLFGIYVRRLRGGGGSRTDIFQTTPPVSPSLHVRQTDNRTGRRKGNI